MTNPCEIGLKCPYRRCSDECDAICVYPYGVIVPEDETFGIIEVVDCPIVEIESELCNLLFAYELDEATRKAVDEYMTRITENANRDRMRIDDIERKADRNDPF